MKVETPVHSCLAEDLFPCGVITPKTNVGVVLGSVSFLFSTALASLAVLALVV